MDVGMYNLWVTPLLVERPKLKDPNFNRELSALTLAAWRRFSEGSSKLTGHSATGQNEAFFQWQKRNSNSKNPDPAYRELAESRPFRGLLSLFNTFTDQYLSRIGKSEEFIRSRNRKLFAW